MSSKALTGLTLAAALLGAAYVSFAQSNGAAVYKTKCSMCHGLQGTPNPGIAKNMGTRAASDPAVKAMSQAQMITITTDGKGKMPAFKSKLTAAQIKDSVDYFRLFAK